MVEADMQAIVHYNRDRRRSSFTRPMRDHEEILEGLRSLKAAKGELNRTMSLSGDKRRGSRKYKTHCFFRPSTFRSSFARPSCLSVFHFFIRSFSPLTTIYHFSIAVYYNLYISIKCYCLTFYRVPIIISECERKLNIDSSIDDIHAYTSLIEK